MSFFNTIFGWLADVSEKLPPIDIQSFYIVVVVALALVAVIIGLTFFASHANKMRRACRKVLAALEDEDVINDDNVAQFTSECFGAKAPDALRETWLSYLGVRFGYPSETVSESEVFDKEVNRPDSIRANVFISVALILTALFAFWGLGAMRTSEIGVVLCLGLLVGAVGYLVLWIVSRRQYSDARKAFEEMQDELDTKVNLQVERDYATDASPLLQVAAIMDGIIAKNTAKLAPTPEEVEAAVAAKTSAAPVGEEPEQMSFVEEDEKTSLENADAVFEESVPEEENPADREVVAETEDSEQVADDGSDADSSEPIPTAEEDGTAEKKISFEQAETTVTDDVSLQEETEDDGEQIGVDRDESVADEINDEDEENMFGRKKKKLQQAELTARGYDDLRVEGELLPDDDGQGAEEATLVAAPAAQQPQAQQVEMMRGSKPESLEGLNIAARPTADSSVTVSLEPEVIYVEENLDEGDEDVKPPRLAKLPHLVDYVLTMKLSRGMKTRVAMLMLQAYSVFKNSPENKAIVIQCLTKVMKALMADQAAAKAAQAAAAQAAQAQEQAAAADTSEAQE